MRSYPIFLLPKGEIMMTAKVRNSEIVLLKKTLFPSNKRYTISNTGLTACIDIEKKLILFGQLNCDGDVLNLKVISFPSAINPKCLCIIKNNIIFGGGSLYNDENEILSHELIMSYSLNHNEFQTVKLPFRSDGKSIDDLLVENNFVIAVDNLVYPKYLIEYDFGNPDYPYLKRSFGLPNNGTYESIKKGTKNDKYIALFSSTSGMDGNGSHINIFIKEIYDSYITLSQFYPSFFLQEELKEKYYWNDIFLTMDKDVLLISANYEGLGIYFIDKDKMAQNLDEEDNDDAKSIIYINPWERKLIKILPIPNNPENVVLIFDEGDENNLRYSYSVENVEKLLEKSGESSK